MERQIREATERGEFDDLPGAGQPIPGLNGRDEENWWVKGFLEREKLSMPLPTSLALRKEVADIDKTVADVRDEPTVRRIATELNRRVLDSHRRRVDGPAIVVWPVDVEQVVATWRTSRGPLPR